MNHPICRSLLTLAFVISVCSLSAQYSSEYWYQKGYLSIAAGPASPGPDLAASVSPGLMANNGLLADVDYNYMLAYGFGVGLNLGLDYYGLNQDAFLAEASPETYSCKGGFLSGRMGLNLLMNVPLEIIPDKFTLNLTAELNGGLRSYTIPDIDLFHSELENEYTEISYRSRANVMGYAGYSTGLQFLFNNRFGVTVSYSVLFATRHRINYSVRAFDAAGNLYEEEDYLSARLDRSGLQFGLLFILSSRD